MKKTTQPEWFEVRLVDVIHDYRRNGHDLS